eukprot:scaffold2830_cov131-Cylindrotheca_fusiformis.AAC.6
MTSRLFAPNNATVYCQSNHSQISTTFQIGNHKQSEVSRLYFNPIMFRSGICALLILFQTSLLGSRAFDLHGRGQSLPSSDVSTLSHGDEFGSRRKLFVNFGVLPIILLTSSPDRSNALASYSSNARNLERMNSGDFSGGSSYDNNPKAEAGRRRRAMVGCKSFIAREEAAELLKSSTLSEKDCNQMVLNGESEFMLQSLRNLDCPTCPYGIKTSRN